MSTNPRSTVVGVFRDRAMAEQAMGALTNAGFGRDQIRYSGSGSTGGTSGGFLGEIKSLFTGQGTTSGNFANDLSDLGVSDEEARYYSDEYRNGRSIIAVKAPGREQEAINIMQRYGAYNNYSVRPGSTGTATPVQQSPDYVQQRSSTPTNAPPPVQQQPQPPQPQPQAARERPVQESQQNEDKLQSLQAQLQETRKQVQEAQAQLQRAREQEAQLRAAKERETQLESIQKQLQEAQAQLQMTLAELHATQARIAQSNQ